MAVRKRKVHSYDRPQQVTRIPLYRPGDWVKIREFSGGDSQTELSGRIFRVKSLSCSITAPGQKRALWRVNFDGGRWIAPELVERRATIGEINKLNRRQ